MAEGVIICLIPDQTYRDARPDVVDPHLTLAYFGRTTDENLVNTKVSSHRKTVDRLAFWNAPIEAKANGLGVLIEAPSVVVDLIDSPELVGFYRDIVTTYAGSLTPVNMTHGFLPHMTIEKLDPNEHYCMVPDQLEVVEFTFTAIGLWYGDLRYEVEFSG